MEAEQPLRLTPLVASSMLVAAVRVALGGLAALAALARGLELRPTLLALALGALGFAVVLLSAERYFVRDPDVADAPAGVEVETRLETLRAAVWPSTVGVTALAIIGVVANPALAALLGGVLAGMGAAALLSGAQAVARERRERGRLLVDRRAQRLYVAR